jgi:outer membrane receptor protein involved in Fe transport
MRGEKSNMRLTVDIDVTESLDASLLFGRSTAEGPWDHWAVIHEHFDLGVTSGLPSVDPRDTPPSDILLTEEPRKVYNRHNDLGPSDSDREYQLMGLTLDWNIGGVLVKSITAHQDWSDEFQNPADGTSIGLFDRIRTADSETFTQELNVSGSTGRVDWIAGLYYMDEERSSRLFFDFPIPALFPLPVPIQIDAQEPQYDTESKSAFIDVTWSVTDDFRLGAGIRRTSEDKVEGHAFVISAQFPDGPMPVFAPCGADLFVQKWDESENTIRGSVEYDLTETSMAYIT